MHTGKSYRLSEFLVWTRKHIYELIFMGSWPVLLYQVADLKWLVIPWTVVGLLGTATAFIVGFKNTQTYNRTAEAQQIWISVLNSSRAWGLMSLDFLKNKEKSKELIYRHLAWLTVMRYKLRRERPWETTRKKSNAEYRKFYCIPENEIPMEDELAAYLSEEELKIILSSRNKATLLMSLQSQTLRELLDNNDIIINYFVEMEKAVRDFLELQGKSERIKNFPYPRQYSIINTLFVRFFCFLLPFGMLKEFDQLNERVSGVTAGHMIWLVIPFSVIISWMYTSLDQVGESTENPFEGSANDVPISQISRMAEIDLREMLGETDLPALLQPRNNIIL